MIEAAAQAQALLATASASASGPPITFNMSRCRKGAPFFLPDTPGVEIHGSIAALPGEAVIEKHFPNSFRDTGLQEKLAGGRGGGAGHLRGHEPHVHRRHHPGRGGPWVFLRRDPRRLRHPGSDLWQYGDSRPARCTAPSWRPWLPSMPGWSRFEEFLQKSYSKGKLGPPLLKGRGLISEHPPSRDSTGVPLDLAK